MSVGAVVLAVALAVHLVAWGAMVVALVRMRMYWRAAVSALVPPFAFYWTLVYGRRREPYAWVATLAVYVVARTAIN